MIDHSRDRAAGLRAEPVSLPLQVGQLEVPSAYSSPAGDEPVAVGADDGGGVAGVTGVSFKLVKAAASSFALRSAGMP